ncbi:DUF1365 domain-containing protein [soil metagenome]
MKSCLYECTVFHRRYSPKLHEFRYRIFLFALDLDELPEACKKVPLLRHNRSGIYSFRDEDHFQVTPGNARANAEAFLGQNGINEKPAQILLLTNTRVLGYVFNPISVWYCYRADGSPLAAIAEVGNTFGELKPFLIPVKGGEFHLRTVKHYYVSPFSDLDLEFDFRFKLPGERLSLLIDDYQGTEKTFVSTLTGRREELTTRRLATFSIKYPLITLKVIFLIHWHALLLWVKKVPFHRKEAQVELQKGVLRPHSSPGKHM